MNGNVVLHFANEPPLVGDFRHQLVIASEDRMRQKLFQSQACLRQDASLVSLWCGLCGTDGDDQTEFFPNGLCILFDSLAVQ
jgi:hypothetical protein